ncbi:MAG: methyl-accepting chemotaxis protein [Clostridiales bacterium]
MISIVSLLVYISYNNLQNAYQLQHESYERSDEAKDSLMLLEDSSKIHKTITDSVIDRNINNSEKEWKDTASEAIEGLNNLEKVIASKEEEKLILSAKEYLNKATELFNEEFLVKLSETNKITNEIREIDKEIDEEISLFDESLSKLSNNLSKEAISADEKFKSLVKNTITETIVIGIIALIILTITSIFIMQSIRLPLNRIINVIKEVSEGNLKVKPDMENNSEIGILASSIRSLIKNITRLTEDTNNLVNSAIDGNLSERADITKHNGEFKNIVEGINNTLNAIVEPIQESSKVLDQLSIGNLNVSVKGNYKGDHSKIKNSLNSTIDILKSYIGELSSVLRQMSDGNFNISISREYLGDFVEIKNSLNTIIDSLNNVFQDINNSSDIVAEGSKQFSSSSQILSQGATEQASSLEEISSSMEQISDQTKHSAENATKVNELTEETKISAQRGNKQMHEMLNSMNEINNSSSNISKIIKVIDEIAFQTNILALNAAVEAARAGQHGKGFAVVAEEVRNLAARSAEAAKETTTLIEGSIVKVQSGTKIANDTATALNQIVDGINKAATTINLIADSSNEQANGISQVNKAISEVSSVVQTNSSTSQQTASASEELDSQAQLLKNYISKFNLKTSRSLNTHTKNNINSNINTTTNQRIDPKNSADKRIALFSDFDKY